jgi:hypothetical protein
MGALKKARVILRARRYGARYCRKIIRVAEDVGIPIALGFALVEQESSFRNIFGSDPLLKMRWQGPASYMFLIGIMGERVTESRYAKYKTLRKAGWGMQGVGLTQLTWYEFQDAADEIGGCWKSEPQLQVGFQLVKSLMDQHGDHTGLARYNGYGPAAELYATSVLQRKDRWQRRLFNK